MVLLHSKKLLQIVAGLLVLIIAALALVYFVSLLSDNDSEQNVAVQSREELDFIQSQQDRLNKFSETANTASDSEVLTAAIEFAGNSSNNTTPRLDAYRLCIQIALELNDQLNKQGCYDAGLLLSDSLQSEEEKTRWRQYLAEVYENAPVNEELTGDEIY